MTGSEWAPRLLSVLRIVAGLQFLEHGTQKFFSFPMRAGAAPELMSLLGVQGCIEIVGGILIILGLFTRPVAFILAGDMAVAYFKVHFAKSFFPALSGGDPASLFCFIFLYLSAAGGGIWSLDAQRHR
ncbi:MAG TPA: DoxX family protein [Rhodopila sp.]|jgi:putative oxidoreductase